MAMTAAQRAEFDQLNAAPVAASGMTPEQKAEFDQLNTPQPRPTTGEQLTDVARSGGTGLMQGAEFLTDVGALPYTMIQRGGKASQRFREADGAWESIKAYGSGFMEPTEFGERISQNFAPAMRAYEPQIGEGEGDAWLDPAKAAARIGGELVATGPLAGKGKVLEMAAKTAPLSIAAGAGGQVLGGDIGEMTGIVAGALTPDAGSIMKLGKMVVDSLVSAPTKLKRLVKSGDTAATASDNEIRQGLQEVLRNVYAEDPDAAITKVDDLFKRVKQSVADGKKGTLGQLSGDAGILNFEKSYAKEFRQPDIDTINMQLSKDATTPIDELAPEGVTQRAADIPQKITAERVTEAGEAVEPFKRQKSTVDVSTGLHKATAQIRDESFAAVKKKWDKIGNPTTDAGVVIEYVDDYFKTLNPNLSRTLKKEFGEAYTNIKGLKGDVDFKTISGIISRISKDSVNMSGEAKQHIDAVQDALYDALGGTAEGARKKAALAYKDHMQKFGSRSQIGKALDKPEGEFGANVVTGGDKGASKRAELLRTTGGVEDVAKRSDDFLRAEFNTKYVDADGKVKQSGVDAFTRRYGEQLSPKLTAELKKVRETGAIDKSLTAELGATDDILSTAKSAMTHKKGVNRVDKLTELLADVDQSTPQAREDIRRMFADDMHNTVTKDGKLSQDGLTKFKRNRDVYEKSGLYTKKELDTIEEGMVEGQKMYMHEDAKILGKLPAEEKKVAEVLAALGGAKIGAMAFGSPLIGAALGRRFAVTSLRKMGTEKINKITFELMMNPQKFVDEVARLNKPGLSDKETASAIADLLAAAASASRTAPITED